MKLSHRGAGMLFTPVAACALLLGGVSPASAASWELNDADLRMCTHPNSGPYNTYTGASVVGTSDVPIHAKVRKLPPGWESKGGTVYPDMLDRYGKFSVLVHVATAPTPAGEYVAELWVSDGEQTRTDEVRISVKDRCY